MRFLEETFALGTTPTINVPLDAIDRRLIKLENCVQRVHDQHVKSEILGIFLHHIHPIRRGDEVHAGIEGDDGPYEDGIEGLEVLAV